jgi:hypothetical protein
MTYNECKEIITELQAQLNNNFFVGGSLNTIHNQLVELATSVNDLNERVNILEIA